MTELFVIVCLLRNDSESTLRSIMTTGLTAS